MRSSFSPPISRTLPLEIPVMRSNRFGVVLSPVLGSSCSSKTYRPTRKSHTDLLDGVYVTLANVELGTEACRRRVVSNGVESVGGSGFSQNS